jgi:protein phosphatase
MIPAERSHLHVTASTHPGMSGKNNEDRYAVAAFRLDGPTPLPVVFTVLCDGIGGHRGGEVAAEVAVEAISKGVASSDAALPLPILREAIQNASQQILALSTSDPNLSGMGATCACAWVIDNQLYIAYVGDSRIYLVRNGAIQQLTIDHTWIQEALDAGVLTPEQAVGHPNAHVIRRHLGSQQLVEPDFRLRLGEGENDEQMQANQGLRLQAGDQILVCSDGLTDLVSSAEILGLLTSQEQQAALNEMTALANQRGGHDNITIVALQVPLAAPASTLAETIPVAAAAGVAAGPRRSKSYLWLTCLFGAVLLVALLAILIGAIFFMTRRSEPPAPTPTSAVVSSTSPAQAVPTTPLTEPATATQQAPLPTASPDETENSALPTATLTPWPTSPP